MNLRYALLATVLLAASPANATVVVKTIDFAVSPSPGAPVNPVVGSFTLTFDDALDYAASTNIVLNTLNINLSPTLAFDYTAITSNFRIGSTLNGVGTVSVGTDDFVFGGDLSCHICGILIYSQQSSNSNYLAVGSTFTVRDGTTAAPEPTTWAMMLAGFGLVGIAMRKQGQTGEVRVRVAYGEGRRHTTSCGMSPVRVLVPKKADSFA